MDILFVELMVFLHDVTPWNRNFASRIFSVEIKRQTAICVSGDQSRPTGLSVHIRKLIKAAEKSKMS